MFCHDSTRKLAIYILLEHAGMMCDNGENWAARGKAVMLASRTCII
jgi:hypothetical protein